MKNKIMHIYLTHHHRYPNRLPEHSITPLYIFKDIPTVKGGPAIEYTWLSGNNYVFECYDSFSFAHIAEESPDKWVKIELSEEHIAMLESKDPVMRDMLYYIIKDKYKI